jgi:hypothetical protein
MCKQMAIQLFDTFLDIFLGCWKGLFFYILWRKNEQKIQPKRKPKDICIQYTPKTQAKKLSTQIGGMAIISQKNAAVRHHKSNKDPRGLG